ncbi:Amuc_1099 family pilus-like system protein [Haloferula rosea]|uniref:Uncharacterized protein n=1 Tax=Haloferula rosea TaxID=490093 RepID=A0A934VHK1_9BACT|nr:Amuc_1099 family pilus-like system protein [Haloferula rosea]MBK1828755.1 hypothetical protein [Haloferula rosea]
MSKAPKNIEKIVLGVGAVAGLGLAALGFMKAGAVEEDFSDSVGQPGKSDTSVAGAAKVAGTLNSLQSNRVYESAEVENPKIGQRPVDLFVGVPLYANRDNPNNPVDPLLGDNIHPPIPNEWWLEYDADMTFADSPQRDDDQDGFTNLEEFTAKTSPTDAKDHPPLIAKLSYQKEESEQWLVLYGSDFSGKWVPKLDEEFSKGIDGKQMKNKVSFTAPLEPGDEFFAEEPLKGRFKFLNFEKRTVRNERLNIDEEVTFAMFEDLSENKKGKKYEIPNRLPRAQRENWVQYDRTAFLDLQAVGEKGKVFQVEEGTQFALPSGGKEKTYLLKEVTPESIVVEFEGADGPESVTIPKGGLPDYDLSR